MSTASDTLREITSNPNWINEVIDIVRPVLQCPVKFKYDTRLTSQLIDELACRGVSRITPEILVGLYLKIGIGLSNRYTISWSTENWEKIACEFAENYPRGFLWSTNHGFRWDVVNAIIAAGVDCDDILPEFLKRLRRIHYQGYIVGSLLSRFDDNFRNILLTYKSLPSSRRWQFLLGLAMGASIEQATQFRGSMRTWQTAQSLSEDDTWGGFHWLSMEGTLPSMKMSKRKVRKQKEAALAAMTALHKALAHPKAKQYRFIIKDLIGYIFSENYYHQSTIVGLIVCLISIVHGGSIKVDEEKKSLTLRQVNDLFERNDVAQLLSVPMSDIRQACVLISLLGHRPLPDTDEKVADNYYAIDKWAFV